MASWFFRVVQLDDGEWSCRFGSTVYDTHDALTDALDHCKEIAASHRPAQVFLHPLDGVVQTVASFE
jgi:hypothetical protein